MVQKLMRLPEVGGAIVKEMTSGSALPLPQRLKLWRSGFRSSSYTLFNLQENNWSDYVSDVQVTRAGKLNGPFKRILKDKLLFSLMLAPVAHVPEALGIIEGGTFYPLPEGRSQPPTDSLLDILGEQGVVLKPTLGNKGKGVHALTRHGKTLRLDGADVPQRELDALISSLDNYLVTRKVEQAAYASRVFPAATNTIRLITMRDPAAGQVFIPMAMHRFGTNQTAPTDNFQTGGVSAMIDLESGALARAVRHPRFSGGELRWLEHHPETKARITGVTVPCWQEVKATAIRLMNTFPFLNYVGWDVLVTASGVVVIEGNHNINLGIQVHGPLLAHPRARDFYRHHGVVR